MHGGYMQHGDTEKKGILTRQDLLAKVRTALGGRAAEIIYYGKEEGVSSGASGDLITATQIVQAMICSYGMDEEIGLSTIDLSVAANSEYYSKIVMRINERLKEELKIAENIISKNRKAIDELVRELMNKNSLKGDEIERILNDNFCAVDE
jgi:ATP-dependent Zn protease